MGRWSLGFKVLTFLAAMGASLPVSQEPRDFAKVKSADKYWAETGLQLSDLKDVVQDESCQSSLKYFLACANAVNSVLNRMDLELARSGEKLIVKPLRSSDESTERQLLEPWRKFFLNQPQVAQKMKFESILDEVFLKPVPFQASMVAGGINAFLSVFRDPHTYIIPVSYYQKVVAKSSPKTRTLGILISRTPKNFFIRKVYPQSPASEAGLQRGDLILAVNERSVHNFNTHDINEIIRTENSAIRFKIRRDKKVFDVNIARREVEIPSVFTQIKKGEKTLGILAVNKFSKKSCQLTERAIKQLMADGVDGIILDLRDNSGGQIDEAACMASLFLGPGKRLFELDFLDAERENETYYSDRDMLYGGALAILVDRGSASASELLAGSLRDHGRALLVGEPTFGKGTFQEGEIWSQNSKVALFSTKGFYILPSGFSPQMYGLSPDIEVKLANDIQPREAEQYIYALFPPNGPYLAMKKMLSSSQCSDPSASQMNDKQLSKAEEFLFCVQPIAGATDDFDTAF